MKRIFAGAFACALVLAATSALAQGKPPLKLGGILDMSGLYADITGPGSEAAAKMAVEDFGGEVLGRKIEIIAADHLNKADLAANIARDMLDNQGIEMIWDVAASATALAAGEIAKARGKIVMFNGPGSIRLTNEACACSRKDEKSDVLSGCRTAPTTLPPFFVTTLVVSFSNACPKA